MRRIRRILLSALAFALIMALPVTWLLTTQTGARWLINRADAFLPPALTLEGVSGTLRQGLELDAVGWSDDAAQVDARDVFAHVELLPLIRGEIRIEALLAGSADVRIPERTPSDEQAAPLDVDLPVDIYVAELELADISIEAAGQARFIENLRLVASLVDSDLSIDLLTIRADWLSVDADGGLQLQPSLPAALSVSWQFNTDAESFAGVLDLEGDLAGYELKHELSRPVVVDTEGSVRLDAELPMLDLTNRWQDLTWPLTDGQLSSAKGSLDVTGKIDDLGLALSATAALNQFPDSTIELEGQTNLEQLSFSRLNLQNVYGELSASGVLSWSPELSFDAAFELTKLDPAELRPELSGDVAVKGNIEGALVAGELDLEATIGRLSGDLNGNPLSGDGQFVFGSGTLDIEKVRLGIGDNRLQASGRVGDELVIAATIDADDLSQILPNAGGSVRASIDAAGRAAKPAGRMQVEGSELRWSEIEIGKLDARAELDAGQRIDAELRVSDLQSGPRGAESATVTVDGTMTQHRMTATVSAYASELQIAASGAYRQPAWSGTIDTLTLDNEALGRWASQEPAALTASPEFAALAPLCIAGVEGSVCIDGKFSGAADISASLFVKALPLAALPMPLPAGVRTEGMIYADASLTLLPTGLTAAAELDVRDALIRSLVDDEEYVAELPTARLDAYITDGALAAELDLRTVDGNGTITAAVGLSDITAPRSADLSGEASIELRDASLLAALVPDISNPTGRIEGEVTLAGTPVLPEVTGEIRFVDGSLGIRRAGIEVTDINIRVAQESPATLTLRGSAASGDGTLSITGDTNFDTASGVRTVLNIDGERFRILRTADWRATASPDVDIVIDERQIAITGSLEIPEADIRVKDIPASATKPSPDAVVHRDDEASAAQRARQLDLNLDASLGDDVRLAAFGLKTRLAGSVQLRGSSGRPITGFGRVSLEEGTYKSYGQELDIESGLLIFNGPLDNPRLDVRATRQVNDVLAGIHLTGTPANLRSEVYSEPPLRDVEVLSYLLTGRPLSSGTSASDSDLLSKAAFSLGMSGAGSIASRLRNQLGLDLLSVEGGAEDGRIVAGKRLSDKLTVEYGYGLIDRLGSLLLRYQINERLILESRTGTVSNLDIVYRVRKP